MSTKLSVSLLLVCLFPYLILGQKEDAAKERQEQKAALVAQILADIPNLKLGENRAIAYARAGNIVWNTDQKSARGLFQGAVGELINAQTLAESDKRSNASQNELLTGGSTRPQILNAIASHDAELALELLVKTRPAAVARAMAAPALKTDKISSYSGNNNYLAQTEFNLEQSFSRMAAEQNPARAEKLLRDSLAKGISGETLNLLKKLAERNRTAATDLASEIVGKLLTEKFVVDGQPNYQITQTIVGFLNDHITAQSGGNQTSVFNDSQMRELADRLIAYYIENGAQRAGYLSYSIIPIAEKYSPSAVDRLKSIARNGSHQGLYSEGWDPDVQKLMNGENTAEQLVAASRTYGGSMRQQLLQHAASKYIQDGNLDKARDLISDNFSDTALDEAMRNLDSQYSYSLIGQGHFEQAEAIIDQMPEGTRISGLINLANAAFQRDQEKNRSYAVAIVRKARGLVGEPPENSGEMGNLMQIVNAYINIEPSEAFAIYESLLPQMNELSDAAAVINGFQSNGNVRSGEFLLSQGNSFGYYGVEFSYLRSLADKDFVRTAKLIDGFTRREIRISLKLQLAEQL